jgi:hypothetical protein
VWLAEVLNYWYTTPEEDKTPKGKVDDELFNKRYNQKDIKLSVQWVIDLI